MKLNRIVIIVFSIVFVSNICCAQQVRALKVGDKAPRLNVYSWINGDPITEWNREKIYIIEFGATWCTPCAAAIPEMSALQKKYQGDVVVASLFVMERNDGSLFEGKPAYVANVEKYVRKRAELIGYTVGVDNLERDVENEWLKAAGLSGIPQIFVVNENGIIISIGAGLKDVDKTISALKDNSYNLHKMVSRVEDKNSRQISYDPSKLLLIDNNGGNQTDFLFRSILTRYDGKIQGANSPYVHNYFYMKPDSLYDRYEDRLELIGAPLRHFYYMAYADTLSNVVAFRHNRQYGDTIKMPYFKRSYGKYWHEPVLEVADARPFQYESQSTRNRFNYSLKVPKGMGTAAFLRAALQRDLQTYFGYAATVETRLMPYWKLSAPDKNFALSKLKSKDQSLKVQIMDNEMPYVFRNGIMRDMITLLGSTYGYGSLDYGRLPRAEQAAFIDETGITEMIDFTFDRDQTFEQMKTFLKGLGLDLSKGYRPMKVVVIRDSPSSKLSD